MVNIYSQELSAVTHTRLLMKHFKAYGHLAPSFECVSAQTQPGVEQLLIILDKGKWNTMLITAMSMQCITTAPVQLPCHCWLIHLCLCAVLSVVWLCVCVQSCVMYYELLLWMQYRLTKSQTAIFLTKYLDIELHCMLLLSTEPQRRRVWNYIR